MKPSRSKVLLAATTSLALLAALAMYLSRNSKPAEITRATFQQIQVGMSRQDVEAIIGGPARFYGEPTIDSSPWTQIWKYGSTSAGLVDNELERDIDDEGLNRLEVASNPTVAIWIRATFTDESLHLSAFGLLFKACSITAIRVEFDDEGRVIDMRYYEGLAERKPTFLERCRALSEKLNWEE